MHNYITFLHNLDEVYQISISNNQNSIFSEFLKSTFMVLCDNLLKTIGHGFLKFDCMDM